MAQLLQRINWLTLTRSALSRAQPPYRRILRGKAVDGSLPDLFGHKDPSDCTDGQVSTQT